MDSPQAPLDVNLWISIILAIPLAIAANLFTPRIQRWIDRRAERSKTRKIEEQLALKKQHLAQLEKEFALVSSFHADRATFHQHLLVTLMKIALYGAMGGIYGGALGFLGEFSRWEGIGGIVSRSGQQLIALFTSMLIFVSCIRSLKLQRNVRDYEAYTRETEKTLTELKKRISQQSPPPYSSPATGSPSDKA